MKFITWILAFFGLIKPTPKPVPLPNMKYTPGPGEYYTIYATGNLPDHGQVVEMVIDHCKTQSQAKQICDVWRLLVPGCRFSWDFDDVRQIADLAEHLLQTDIQSSGDNGLLLVRKQPKIALHKIWISSLRDEKCPEWIKTKYTEQAKAIVNSEI